MSACVLVIQYLRARSNWQFGPEYFLVRIKLKRLETAFRKRLLTWKEVAFGEKPHGYRAPLYVSFFPDVETTLQKNKPCGTLAIFGIFTCVIDNTHLLEKSFLSPDPVSRKNVRNSVGEREDCISVQMSSFCHSAWYNRGGSCSEWHLKEVQSENISLLSFHICCKITWDKHIEWAQNRKTIHPVFSSGQTFIL